MTSFSHLCKWLTATWGVVVAWIAGHIPDIVVTCHALTEFGRGLLVIGSLILMYRQLRQDKGQGKDGKAGKV